MACLCRRAIVCTSGIRSLAALAGTTKSLKAPTRVGCVSNLRSRLSRLQSLRLGIQILEQYLSWDLKNNTDYLFWILRHGIEWM